MFIQFLKSNKTVSYLLFLVRLYLGWEWLSGGWGKITGGFDATKFLQGALKKAGGEHADVAGWWAAFIKGFALPNVGLFNVIVPWGEFFIGLGLLLGVLTTFAALMAMVMNFSFLFSGTVSTNAQMIFWEIFLVIAGFNAAKIGLDYWIIPYLRTWWNKKRAQ
jgi:thiosulfate dehydrogenase (quinone) large subunit